MVLAAVGQICSTASMAHNLAQCRTLVRKAAARGAQALFLPEASDYIGSSASETISLARSVNDSEFVQGLREEARSAKIPVNVGIHEPSEDGKKVENTLIWIDESGEIVQRYQKLHLFDVEIKDGPILKESNSVERGARVTPPFDTAVGKIGLMICFDLRFPALSRLLSKSGADLLVYPSAFTVPTGRAHWSTLLRARAIENQAYVIAAGQCGPHNDEKTRMSYGHSIIIDPWGKVLAELGGWDEEGAGEEEGVGAPQIAVADIDQGYVEKIRREMPLLRRTDVYADP